MDRCSRRTLCWKSKCCRRIHRQRSAAHSLASVPDQSSKEARMHSSRRATSMAQAKSKADTRIKSLSASSNTRKSRRPLNRRLGCRIVSHRIISSIIVICSSSSTLDLKLCTKVSLYASFPTRLRPTQLSGARQDDGKKLIRDFFYRNTPETKVHQCRTCFGKRWLRREGKAVRKRFERRRSSSIMPSTGKMGPIISGDRHHPKTALSDQPIRSNS